MTAFINFEVEEDVDYTYQFTWEDPSTNLPIDITNFTASLQAKENFTDTLALIDLSTTAGTIVLGGATGNINITIAATVTKNVTWSQLFYDLYLIDPVGIKFKVSKGFITLIDGVTKP